MTCPCCRTTAPPTLLGRLGRLTWLRCRICGIDFNTTTEA